MNNSIYYDKQKDCLIFINTKANNEYWDDLWNLQRNWIETTTKKISLNNSLFRLIDNYTEPNAKILEAGCGRGQFVYGLQKKGYDTVGVDYAEKTVKILNESIPELKIVCADIRNMGFIPSDSIDLYYSGGVIEHFWYGYDDIILEAKRVLKPNGKMIITFPFVNKMRHKIKSKLPNWEKESQPKNFYQFALNLEKTESNIEMHGFKLLYRNKRNGLKGFIEQHPKMPFAKNLYKAKKRNLLTKSFRVLISKFLAKIGYGHTVLLVFEKTDTPMQ